ncbi:hypothetical protein BMS3Bbin06_02143 [bacterium BMS3Bbin06]|nr:hypothetical protein BMS3Abin08_02000 [bacterium BMS3Abin08]GBE35601.1 hypothetical protein BMS3Bbin06_02143 [bacterium BMS3Bbin06]
MGLMNYCPDRGVYSERTSYFCSRHCKERFDKNPLLFRGISDPHEMDCLADVEMRLMEFTGEIVYY